MVNEILEEFGNPYGLRVSHAKSKALCSKGVSVGERSSVASICPIAMVRDLGKYLGFHLPSGRASHNTYNYLLDRALHPRRVDF